MANESAISFHAAKDQISQIRKKFLPSSISCGALHDGQVIFRHCEGFANVENGLERDADNLYLIGSCTKAFTSATCAIIENEGTLNWAAPVSSYLPDFNTVHDPEIGKRATLDDLLSHSTGFTPVQHAFMDFYDEYYNQGHDRVKIASHLPVAYNFRSKWLYNNTIHRVVGELIAKLTGKSAGQAVKGRIFEPLGMKRTCTSAKEYTDNNIATGYSVLDEGPALPLDDPKLEDEGIQGAAGFVRSSVNNMLMWAKAAMEAEGEAEKGGGSPKLAGVEFARCSRRLMTLGNGLGESSYGFGWFRHTRHYPPDGCPRSDQTLYSYLTPP